MAIREDMWRFRNSIEHEIKYVGNYGAKGEKRAARKKATPEQVKKQNQINKENRLRRAIKANFLPDDLWVTLKYPAGAKKSAEEVKKDMSEFLRKLRKTYKKRGEPLLYVYRMEIGRHGGVHIHILVNRLRGDPATDLVIRDCWSHGSIYWTTTYESGGYEKLASYITKAPDEEVAEQLSFLPEEERKTFVRYSSSRNLIRPEPERKDFKRKTVRDILENGPKPKPGFYIDQESVVMGKNPYTGMSYIHYTEYRLQKDSAEDLEREREKRRKRALTLTLKPKRGVKKKKLHKKDGGCILSQREEVSK